MKMKIGIIGVGYVGGTNADFLKDFHEIFLYDKYKSPYDSEENLNQLSEKSELILLCVPTPMQYSGEIDYSNINDALDCLSERTKKVNRNPEEILIVIRSTVITGTTKNLSEKYSFKFAFNPEFLREKNALEDMKKTTRIVIGANDDDSYEKVKAIYLPLFPDANYIYVDTDTAEMIKYASNVMLTGQIALANEIYQICNSVGVDYEKVKNAILMDKRIARNIDVPGPDGCIGFGGKCLPKDLNALMSLARKNNYNPVLLEEIWKFNNKIRKNKDWLKIKGVTSENNFKKQ